MIFENKQFGQWAGLEHNFREQPVPSLDTSTSLVIHSATLKTLIEVIDEKSS